MDNPKHILEKLSRLHIAFYRTSTGDEPVKEWLEQYGWPNDVVVERNLDNGLWQISGHLRGGFVALIFFSIISEMIVLLHACIMKIPLNDQDHAKEIELARKRLKEVDPRHYLH
jgi:phage-related protein